MILFLYIAMRGEAESIFQWQFTMVVSLLELVAIRRMSMGL
jgi:hypothetical protein